jgi:hypothetical protein
LNQFVLAQAFVSVPQYTHTAQADEPVLVFGITVGATEMLPVTPAAAPKYDNFINFHRE